MPKLLTQEQIDLYRRDGFLGPIDLLSTDEALTLRNQIEAVEAEMAIRSRNAARSRRICRFHSCAS